jgi:hypothetical protein
VNKLTPLLLLALVVGLGFAIWKQTEREDPTANQVHVPLFEDLDAAAITRVRIDNIERSQHLTMERDGGGRWFLTDPIAYPARSEMLINLLDAVARNRAWVIPESQRDSVEESLAKPRAILELREEHEGREPRTHRLEMGQVDVDGQRMNVRVAGPDGGRIVRTMRDLETMLETGVTEWRNRRVFDMRYDEVVEIRREGIDTLMDGQVDMTLHARRDGSGWWIDRPVRIQGDPGFLGTWAGVLSAVRVRRFASDVPDPDLAAYGFDSPIFTLALVDRRGREQVLEIGKPVITSGYYARRKGQQFIWELEERDFSQLFYQPDKLFDHVVVRLPREVMESLSLRGREYDLRLTQDLASQDWTLAWRGLDEGSEWTAEMPAHSPTVDRVLAFLGRKDTVAAYLWDMPVEQAFGDDAALQAIWVQSGGQRFGGRMGAEYTTEGGTPTRLWLRERENRVCLVPADVAELLALTPEDFLSLQLVELSEPTTKRITIQTGERVPRIFRKTLQTTWIHHDLKTDALPELLPVIEHLFFLQAERHVPRGEEQELHDVVSVRIQGRDGDTQFDVGRTAGGEVRALMGSRQSVLKFQGLHAALLEIASKAPVAGGDQ